MRTLIVDDELVSRKKAQKIMSTFGECDTAESGVEALEAFRSASQKGLRYDLITMDVQMPDMDGLEALRRIRAWEGSCNIAPDQGVKVLMMTADKAAETVYSSFGEGCEGYVVKPFDKARITAALRDVGLLSRFSRDG